MSGVTLNPSVSVCPLCASYVEVESGWDGPEYVWSCDHEYAVDEPGRMTVAQFVDPELRESARSENCMGEWDRHVSACYRQRIADDERDYATLTHALDLQYTAADRRARYDYRRLSATEKYAANLRHVYTPKIQAHLDQHRHFLAAIDQETMEAQITMHRDLHRQTFGDTIEFGD